MNKLLLFLLFPLLVCLIACKKDRDQDPVPEQPEEVVFAVDIGQSEIPYVVVITETAIRNEPKIPATLRIFERKEEVQKENIGIEYRGSTSFRLSDKKSFGVEVWDVEGNDTDASFFGFPEEEDWILQGHIVNVDEAYIFDRTLMYHYLGYELFRAMGRYSSRCQFVELELNGEYQGVYVFMEKLKRDRERIDIARLEASDEDATSISGGYILKIDKSAGGDLNLEQPLEYFENNWEDDARYTPEISFRSSFDIYGEPLTFEPYRGPYHPDQYLETYFLYEYPDYKDITEPQKKYIQDYITNFEMALLSDDFESTGRTYTDYIDLESFVDFFLINEVTRNVDGYRLSTYMFKDRGEKLKMGPIWDINIAYDNGGRIPEDAWIINYNDFVSGDAWSMPFWWPRLMEDPVFRSAVRVRWNELRTSTLSTNSLLARVDETASYLKDNRAIDRNYAKWGLTVPVNYDESISSLKGFLERRTEWMDTEIAAF